MKAENTKKSDCPQRDSAEHEGYAEVRRSFRTIWKERDSAEPELLERILERDNLNRAFKKVKARKGAPGIDGMTVDDEGRAELSAYILSEILSFLALRWEGTQKEHISVFMQSHGGK